MIAYTICHVAEVLDVFGDDYPGEMCSSRSSVWNDEPGDAELVICSLRLDDPGGEVEAVPDSWPVK